MWIEFNPDMITLESKVGTAIRGKNIWRSRAVSLQLLTFEVRPRRTAECGEDEASEGFAAGNAKWVLT